MHAFVHAPMADAQHAAQIDGAVRHGRRIRHCLGALAAICEGSAREADLNRDELSLRVHIGNCS